MVEQVKYLIGTRKEFRGKRILVLYKNHRSHPEDMDNGTYCSRYLPHPNDWICHTHNGGIHDW